MIVSSFVLSGTCWIGILNRTGTYHPAPARQGTWLKFSAVSTIAISNTVVISYRTFSSTGWRRPIGCLKLQVILRKRATNYRAFFRKMTYKDKASYGSSPPCSGLTFKNSYLQQDKTSSRIPMAEFLKRSRFQIYYTT